MNVQARADITNRAFILAGKPISLVKESETFLQDAGRSGDIEAYTLVSYNPTSKKWVVFEDETATDGTQIPAGVVLQAITEAAIKAGDVVNIPVLIGDAIIAEDLLVIESSKTLDTIINVPTNLNKSVEQMLRMIGIVTEATVNIDELENT